MACQPKDSRTTSSVRMEAPLIEIAARGVGRSCTGAITSQIGFVHYKASSISCLSNSVFGKNASPIVPTGQEHWHPLLVRPIFVAEFFNHLLLFL